VVCCLYSRRSSHQGKLAVDAFTCLHCKLIVVLTFLSVSLSFTNNQQPTTNNQQQINADSI
ncbi:MAG TPA: hypothetical protein DCE56_15970, partial [Cyanobacteria bacterium UBA8553]|nr:hypothetical protein [Cyanobacteria bacterium UBA8553]